MVKQAILVCAMLLGTAGTSKAADVWSDFIWINVTYAGWSNPWDASMEWGGQVEHYIYVDAMEFKTWVRKAGTTTWKQQPIGGHYYPGGTYELLDCGVQPVPGILRSDDVEVRLMVRWAIGGQWYYNEDYGYIEGE